MTNDADAGGRGDARERALALLKTGLEESSDALLAAARGAHRLLMESGRLSLARTALYWAIDESKNDHVERSDRSMLDVAVRLAIALLELDAPIALRLYIPSIEDLAAAARARENLGAILRFIDSVHELNLDVEPLICDDTSRRAVRT